MLITNRSNEQMVMSVDTGDEIGIRLCRQPPLPPPHPPRTYPPDQLRRWWVNKECIKEMKLSHALNEFKSLFSSSNTYSVKYFDGTYLMPIVNDKDLQSCLRYFYGKFVRIKHLLSLSRRGTTTTRRKDNCNGDSDENVGKEGEGSR